MASHKEQQVKTDNRQNFWKKDKVKKPHSRVQQDMFLLEIAL